MKKNILLMVIGSVFTVSVAYGDWYVPVTSLPQKAQAFIKQIYPQAQIWSVERDGGKYEVQLSNGAKIDFGWGGDWVEIDGEYQGVPPSALPAAVAQAIQQTHPGAIIISVEKEWGNYKVKLNNMMEVFVSANGQVMGQKWDD